jgi:Ohr subfamily peroxiredoxin
MITVYRTKAHNTGGRSGHVKIADTPIDFDTAPPTVVGAPRPGVNPEQLFAATYATCFGGAVGHVIRVQKLPATSYSVDVEIRLDRDPVEGDSIGADIVMTVKGLDQAGADALVAEANRICPYSKATRGNIPLTVRAVVE